MFRVPLPKSENVKLLLCAECGIHTNHHKTPSGQWVCWCGTVRNEQEPELEPVPVIRGNWHDAHSEQGSMLAEAALGAAFVLFVVIVICQNWPW